MNPRQFRYMVLASFLAFVAILFLQSNLLNESASPTMADASFSADERYLVTSFWDYAILWDVENCRELKRLEGEDLYELEYSPNGRWVAAAGRDRYATIVQIWELETGREIHQLRAQAGGMRLRHNFHPDGRSLVTVAYSDADAIIWDVETGQEIRRIRIAPDANYKPKAVQFSPDGRYIAVGDNTSVGIWDAVTGHQVHRLEFEETEPQAHQPSNMFYSPDGRYLAYSGIAATTIWDTSTGEVTYRLGNRGDNLFLQAFSPDGRYIVGSHNLQGRSIFEIWQADLSARNAVVEVEDNHGIEAVSYSPYGRYIVTTYRFYDRVDLWDAKRLVSLCLLEP